METADYILFTKRMRVDSSDKDTVERNVIVSDFAKTVRLTFLEKI